MLERFALMVRGEIDAALSAAVVEATISRALELPATFHIKVGVDLCNGEYGFIDDEPLQPFAGADVAILAAAGESGGVPEWHCLCVGRIIEKKVHYAPGGAGTVLELRGEDRSTLLDVEEEDCGSWNTVADAVRALLGRHFDELVVDAPRLERDSSENQLHCRGNQRRFLTRLAGRTDTSCWIETAAAGVPPAVAVREIAHFEPVPARAARAAIPPLVPDDGVRPLQVGDDGCHTVDRFEVTVLGNRPNRTPALRTVDPSGQVVDQTVEGPSNPTLGARGAEAGGARRASLGPSIGVTPDERALAGQAAVNDAAWFVEAEAETTVQRYGDILRPSQQISVRGAGVRNDVTYLIRAVEHRIDAAAHTMRLTLVSNAQGG